VSSFDPPASESTPIESSTDTAARSSAAPERNGPNHTAEHAAAPNHVSPEPPAAEAKAERTPVDRAEEMVDQIAESVASFTSRWGRRFVRILSRVREEAEDIWGEAQSIRRGDQP
jgi:hypothetical protein